MARKLTLDWIEANSIKVPESGCWIWGKYVDALGYGRAFYNGRAERVHRISLELSTGTIPEGKQANHHCDVRCCVNPNHIYAGDKLDNARDAVRRGRHPSKDKSFGKKISEARKNTIIGDANPNTKIFSWQRPIIKEERKSGAKVKDLAAKYGVATSYLYSLLRTF